MGEDITDEAELAQGFINAFLVKVSGQKSIDEFAREAESPAVKSCWTSGCYHHASFNMCLCAYHYICPNQKLEKNGTYTCTREWKKTN